MGHIETSKRNWRWWSALATYAVGPLAAGFALALALLLEKYFISSPAALFICAVMFSSWMGGIRAGLLALVLSMAAFVYYFTTPGHSFNLALEELPRVIIVSLSGVFVISLSVAQRRANEALKKENAERKRAEESLREHASLLDLTHDTIFVRDMNDVITYWNRGAEELYGWKRQEAVGQISHELTQTVFPEPLEQINSQLIGTGRWEGELVHSKRDGTQVVVMSRWSLQRNPNDEPTAILETNNDITERKQANAEQRKVEEALREAQADLAHVSRVTTMGELTASLAHEVNQPITAAVTNANTCVRWLAGDTPNIHEARDAAIRGAKDATRASEIIRRIRLLFQKGAMQRELVDVNDVTSEIVLLLRGEASRYSVPIRTELADSLPQIMGDRVQLQQVILNLIMNSIDALKDVDGHREILIKSDLAEEGNVLISVSDTGVGLPTDQADQIFEAFFTTKLEGTGMGLSISRSIVESHGGRLWAENNPTKGARFHFTLST